MKHSLGWNLHGDGRTVEPGAVVEPDERLSWPRTIGIGMQHVVAMFGATLLHADADSAAPAQSFFGCDDRARLNRFSVPVDGPAKITHEP